MGSILPLLEQAQIATRSIKALADEGKQQLLRNLAAKLLLHSDEIILENRKDLDKMSDEDPKKDRLLLNKERITGLTGSLQDIALLPDPANQVLSEKKLENGLLVRKLTVPLGVVGVIYESRPNVTVDVAALCLRSGNACV